MHLDGIAGGGTYLLPCVPIVLLKAYESVDFRMRILVPVDSRLGKATLTWRLREPSGPPLKASITIS
jgi:hypothetical protein